MKNKLMTPTEKEVDFFSIHSKECNACQRHGKDIMLSYTVKENTTQLRVLRPVSDIEEQFSALPIRKSILRKIIEASRGFQITEQKEPQVIIDLFITNRQAEDLIKILKTTVSHNKN